MIGSRSKHQASNDLLAAINALTHHRLYAHKPAAAKHQLRHPLNSLFSSTNNPPSQSPAMITIYHNPRCSKSRGACDLITSTYDLQNEPVKVVEYLREPLTAIELKELSRMLGCPVRDMLRDTEAEFKDLGLANPELTDEQLYQAIEQHPILLQRPIIVRNGKAVIGRPPENVKALFGE